MKQFGEILFQSINFYKTEMLQGPRKRIKELKLKKVIQINWFVDEFCAVSE